MAQNEQKSKELSVETSSSAFEFLIWFSVWLALAVSVAVDLWWQVITAPTAFGVSLAVLSTIVAGGGGLAWLLGLLFFIKEADSRAEMREWRRQEWEKEEKAED